MRTYFPNTECIHLAYASMFTEQEKIVWGFASRKIGWKKRKRRRLGDTEHLELALNIPNVQQPHVEDEHHDIDAKVSRAPAMFAHGKIDDRPTQSALSVTDNTPPTPPIELPIQPPSASSQTQPPLDDLDQPIAQRRGRRVIILPTRFRDDLPQPHPALPPPESNSSSENVDFAGSPPLPSPPLPRDSRVYKTLRSPRNTFGLFRQYRAEAFPRS